jgi:hypothetical protein
MTDTIAFAQYLTLRSQQSTTQFYFQNYWINESISYYSASQGRTNLYDFMPFAFSGTILTKSGDNQAATLAFPNNSLSRAWAETAVNSSWIADVSTVIVDPDNSASTTNLMQYTAQVIAATWDSTALQLQLASVLDAVGADIPRKKLTQQLVGQLPLTASVRVR